MSIVRIEPNQLPAPSEAELNKLMSMQDSDIDLTDIPEITAEEAKRAIPNPFFKPIKKQITIRIDADLLAWLKKDGKGYQTKLNNIIR
nr:BrnA antitoxin family protein [Succinivibrio sp.]